MSALGATAGGFGKSPSVRTGERFPQVGETNRRVINAIKEMYENPAVVFGRWLGISDKTAKRKLGFERSLSVEELGQLIRSERGFEIVGAVMGDARPEWWKLCHSLMDAADIRKMQLAAQKRVTKILENAIDADKELSAAISRAEALSVQDEDHMRHHVDALRSMGSLPNRTVAKGRVR